MKRKPKNYIKQVPTELLKKTALRIIVELMLRDGILTENDTFDDVLTIGMEFRLSPDNHLS